MVHRRSTAGLHGTPEEIARWKVSSCLQELRDIRARTRLRYRMLKEVNRTILCMPEGLAYDAYHAVLDVRLWQC
jgi:hypothetical protein